jgi:hypothetical protein
MENGKVTINWDQYGTDTGFRSQYLVLLNKTIIVAGIYELAVDAASGQMVGHKKDQPENWRRAQFLRALGSDAISSIPPHDHSHKHDEHCGHH